LISSFTLIILFTNDSVTTLFHEPFRRARGTTDANSTYTLKPGTVYLVRTFNQVSIGIHPTALIIENLAITAFTTTDEENEIVTGSKLRDVWHTVGYGATDGVEGAEGSVRRDVRLDIINDTVKLFQ
jgi:hypothetical protein